MLHMTHGTTPDRAPYTRDPRPFSAGDGSVGALLIHGFAGLPGEMRLLGDYLVSEGYAVECPLLAGHGGTQEDLARTTWRDWLSSADDAFERLRARCSAIVLIGFSMGGALAAHLAARRTVAGLVMVSTPLGINNPLAFLLPVARFVVPYLNPVARLDLTNPRVLERLRTYVPDLDIDPTDKEQVEQLRAGFRVSLQAVYQLSVGLRGMRRALPRVTAPALIVQAMDDETAPRASIDTIYRLLGSEERHRERLSHGGHMLLVGPRRDKVFPPIAAFVRRVAAPTDVDR